MDYGPLMHFLSRLMVTVGQLLLVESPGAFTGRFQAGPDRRNCKGVYPAPLFPQVIREQGKPSVLVSILYHEVSAPPHQGPVQRLDKLNIPKYLVMLPQGQQDQAGLILLDRS
jgi:hypothetical protein